MKILDIPLEEFDLPHDEAYVYNSDNGWEVMPTFPKEEGLLYFIANKEIGRVYFTLDEGNIFGISYNRNDVDDEMIYVINLLESKSDISVKNLLKLTLL